MFMGVISGSTGMLGTFLGATLPIDGANAISDGMSVLRFGD